MLLLISILLRFCSEFPLSDESLWVAARPNWLRLNLEELRGDRSFGSGFSFPFAEMIVIRRVGWFISFTLTSRPVRVRFVAREWFNADLLASSKRKLSWIPLPLRRSGLLREGAKLDSLTVWCFLAFPPLGDPGLWLLGLSEKSMRFTIASGSFLGISSITLSGVMSSLFPSENFNVVFLLANLFGVTGLRSPKLPFRDFWLAFGERLRSWKSSSKFSESLTTYPSSSFLGDLVIEYLSSISW